MIAKIIVWMLLLIILPDVYLFRRLKGKYPSMPLWKQLLWWFPAVVILVFTVWLSTIENFVPDDFFWIRLYLTLVGLVLVPKSVFCLCSFIGWTIRKTTRWRFNYGTFLGDALSLLCVLLFFYGLLFGWRGLDVKRIDLYYDDLPAAFEGYTIAQFTDAHVGTFSGRDSYLQRDVDTLNALGADMIVFTGDLQNVQPAELPEFSSMLSSLKARDGVYAILGNHDYSKYIGGSAEYKRRSEKATQSFFRSFGWHLLMNEHAVIRHGADSIYIAGEECDDKSPRYDHHDLAKTYRGIPLDAFVVDLQHNPCHWDSMFIAGKEPHAVARLTLSGHTHGGQIQIFGLRPTQLSYKYDYGLYTHGSSRLYVSGGIGALVPFRIGMTPEIVLFTLHRK